MKTHAPAPKKNAAPVVAAAAPSNLFQRRPFPKPEETEEEIPELQGRELDFSQPASAMSIPLYPPSPSVQRQPEEEEDLKRKPETTLQRQTALEEEEGLQRAPQLQREAMPEEEEKLQTKVIQPKLTIGQPGDKYEQEADNMATRVMAMPDAGLQREAMPEEEELQTKPHLQREAMPEEDDELQMRPQLQRQAMPEEEDETLQTKPENSKFKIQNSKFKTPIPSSQGRSPHRPRQLRQPTRPTQRGRI